MTTDIKEDIGSENGFVKEEKEILEEKKFELKSSLSLKQDKTVIETKSSTEILTELFSAFNAEPPVIEEVCGDGDKTFRTTKKNTVSRRSSESGEDDSAGDKVKEKKGEKKKKEKKKKHKHKSSKHRHSSKKESDSSGINRLHRSREKDKDDIATYSKIKEKILKASASKSKTSCEQLPELSKEDPSKQFHDKCELTGVSVDNPQNILSESIIEPTHSSHCKYEQSRNCLCESSRKTDLTGTETLEGKDSLDISGSLLSVTSNDDVSAIEVGVIPLPEDCTSQEIHSSAKVKQNEDSKINLKEETNDGDVPMTSQNRTEELSLKGDRIVKKDGKSNQSKDGESYSCDKIESVNILVHEIEPSSAQLVLKQPEIPASSDLSVTEKLDSATSDRTEQSVNEKTESGKSVKSSISISDSKAKSKIKIKNLKFSTVFQQTLKEAEEQARKKEEEEQVKHNSESENVTLPSECSESKVNETQNGDATDRDSINDHSITNEFKSVEYISTSCTYDAKEPKFDKGKEVVESGSKEEDISWSTKLENGDKHCSKKEQGTSEEDGEDPRKDKAEKIDEAIGRKGSDSKSSCKSKAKEKKKRRKSRSKSREKSKKRKRSKSPGKAKSRSRSSSVSKNKKRKRSRSRSESKSKRKKRSRSRSKGGKSSGNKASKKSRSKHRKKSRSKSKERRKSRSRSESMCKDSKISRSVSKERKSVSNERKSESNEMKIEKGERKSVSRERRCETKTRKSESKERKSESKERKSKSKERKCESKERKSRSKSKGRNRSSSKDYIRSESRDGKRSESRERGKSRSISKETKRCCSKEKKRSISKERKDRSKERKRSRSRKQSKRRSRSCSRKSRSHSRRKSRSRSRKRSGSQKKSRSESRKRSRSRKKSRSRSRKESRSVSRRSRSRSKKRSSSRGRKRSHSRSRRKSRSESRKESSSRNRRRSRSRSYRKSRSPSRQSRSRSRRKSRSRSRRSGSRRSRSRKRSLSLTKSWRNRSERESRERSKRSSSRKRSRSHRKSRSLSKKRSRSHSKIRSKSDERRSRSRSRKRSRGKERGDKEKDSRRSKTVEKSKLAAAGGSESTGPSSITSGDGGKSGEGDEEKLDKARLLEIARKNAVNLLQQGSLPPSVVGKDQKGKLLTLKAGGKSVEELTEYCKELSRKEAMGESSDSDGEGGSGCGSHVAPVIHHPFQIKERPTPGMIGIGIRSSLPPANAIMDKPSDQSKLRMQFPVSSGQEHRKTESDSPLAICYHEEAEIVEDADSVSGDVPEEKEKIIIDPKDQVFPDYSNCEQNMDIGSIVSQRLTALRKLQENPDDLDALNEMTQAQKDMQVWAESKSQPGLFTGSTGAKVLSAAELASGSQAWARKDQLKCATPLTGGMGMLLLQKMGWRPGEGLGKNKEGVLEPLKLDVKTDKRGLVSQEELHRHTNVHRRGHVTRSHPRHSFGKHPVSVLVEICSKRRWKVPHFQLVFESGPDHKKSFLFKAIVNGVEYQPPAPSPNKKQAKAHAASICLQAIGVYPPTMNYDGACI